MKNYLAKITFLFTFLFSFSGYSQFYSYTKYTTKDGLKDYNLTRFYQDSTGLLYLGGDGGIYSFEGKNLKFISLNLERNLWSSKSEDIIKTDKGLLIGTRKEKAYFLKNFKEIITDGYASKRLEYQRTWFACDSTSTFRGVICDTILSTEEPEIVVDKELNFLAVKQDSFFIRTGNKIKIIPLNFDPKNIWYSKCVVDNQKNAYYIKATKDRSTTVYQYERSVLKKLFTYNHLSVVIDKFFIDGEKQLWISNGANKEILKFKDGNLVRKFVIPNSAKYESVNCDFLLAKNGTIWLSNPTQIIKIDTGMTVYKNLDPVSNNLNVAAQRKIYELKNGNLIFNFKLFDGKNFYDMVSEAFYIEHKNIFIKDIFEDAEENVWYSTNQGLFKFSKTNYFKQHKNYNSLITLVTQLYDGYLSRRVYFKLDSVIISSAFQNEILNSFSLKKYFPCLKFSKIEEWGNFKHYCFRNDLNELFIYIETKPTRECRKELIIKISKDNSFKIFDLTNINEKYLLNTHASDESFYNKNAPINFMFDKDGNLCYFFNRNLMIVKEPFETVTEKELGLAKKDIFNLNTSNFNILHSSSQVTLNNKYVIIGDNLYTIEKNKLIRKVSVPLTDFIIQDNYDNSIVFLTDKNTVSVFKNDLLKTFQLNSQYKNLGLYDSLILKTFDNLYFKMGSEIYKTNLSSAKPNLILIKNKELCELLFPLKKNYNAAVIYSEHQLLIKTGFKLYSIHPDSLFEEKINTLSVKLFEENVFLWSISYSNTTAFSDNEGDDFYYYYDLKKPFINPIKPPVNFTLLSYSQGENIHEFMPNVKDLKIPYNVFDINAEFQGVCLTDGLKLKYKTRLIGLSNDWEERSSEFTYVRYPTLSPGSYTFQVKACNNDGVWNETPAEFSFTILPPWYRTWYAYLCYALAAVMSIRGYIRNRTKKLEKEKRKLEKTVEERTAEVVQQKHLIEEKHKEITDSIHYAKRIQTALLPTEKYIDRNLNDLQKNKDKKKD